MAVLTTLPAKPSVNPVNCQHWQDCGRPNAGRCTIKAVGAEFVSYAVCGKVCQVRLPFPGVTDPEQPKPGTWPWVAHSWADALSYSKSKLSEFFGDPDPAVFAQRVLSCHGDPAKGIAPCPARAWDAAKGFHYCGECQCTNHEDAQLSSAPGSTAAVPLVTLTVKTKLRYKYLECVRQRPGFSNAKGDEGQRT